MELKPADNPSSDSDQEKSSSLGLQWHIREDVFSIKMQFKDRPKNETRLPWPRHGSLRPPRNSISSTSIVQVITKRNFPTQRSRPTQTTFLRMGRPNSNTLRETMEFNDQNMPRCTKNFDTQSILPSGPWSSKTSTTICICRRFGFSHMLCHLFKNSHLR